MGQVQGCTGVRSPAGVRGVWVRCRGEGGMFRGDGRLVRGAGGPGCQTVGGGSGWGKEDSRGQASGGK